MAGEFEEHSGRIIVDGDSLTIAISRIHTVEELSAFIDRLHACARAVWPVVVFPGEDGFDDDDDAGDSAAPAAATPSGAAKRREQDYSGMVMVPGSATERIFLKACELSTRDVGLIAKALGMQKGPVGATIWRLQKGGHLSA